MSRKPHFNSSTSAFGNMCSRPIMDICINLLLFPPFRNTWLLIQEFKSSVAFLEISHHNGLFLHRACTSGVDSRILGVPLAVLQISALFLFPIHHFPLYRATLITKSMLLRGEFLGQGINILFILKKFFLGLRNI